MKASSVSEIKHELQTLGPVRLQELCLKLIKYKKENKELLSYLLFEADNEQGYITSVKEMMEEEFSTLTKSNLYLTKKSLRKILRITNKHIKYTSSKQAEVELLIHFCLLLKKSGLPLSRNTALQNIYLQQFKKINAAIGTMHEDLQYDYAKQLEMIS